MHTCPQHTGPHCRTHTCPQHTRPHCRTHTCSQHTRPHCRTHTCPHFRTHTYTCAFVHRASDTERSQHKPHLPREAFPTTPCPQHTQTHTLVLSAVHATIRATHSQHSYITRPAWDFQREVLALRQRGSSPDWILKSSMNDPYGQ